MSYFQDWLAKSFKPCCLVLCSDKAKELIAQNNLTPSEFLRPFGDFRGKKLQIQFNEKDKEPISLNDFILDFYDSDNYSQVKRESVINYIETMFAQNEPSWNLNYPLFTKNLIENEKNKLVVGQYCTPWFKEFEKTILECLNFDEYELYQQPLINIFIASIEEKVAIINESLVKKVPKIINDKRYDSSKESVIIILNDCKDKVLKKEEIEKCKTRFSKYKNYYIINWDINCPPFADFEGEQKKISENFKKYFHKSDIYNSSNEQYKDYNKKQYGKYINVEQYKKYREEFLHYFGNVFIPKIGEKIINPLNEIIKKNTGLVNIFKKKEKNFYRNTNIYRFTELERSYYNLGIIYFYFHNYDLSNDNIKLLRNTLKDKSEPHKDRVKELKAMSKFLQKKIAKKEFNYLEEIKLNYGNALQLIRQEIIIIKMLESKLSDENKESMEEIYKMIYYFMEHNRTNYSKAKKDIIIDYFNALLEEKLAVYNLYEKKCRKYVFNMAITGKLFQQLEKRNYALYSLSKLLYFIDNPSPSFEKLRTHYNQLLGEVCNSLKYEEGCFKFFKNSFEFSSIFTCPSDSQNKYLQYYLSIVSQIRSNKNLYNNIDINELNIPQVDNASLFVLENDDYDIKVRSSKIENSKEKNWLIFGKYIEKDTSNVYASLDEIDLNHLKLIHDLTNETNKQITNVHTDRYFQGNINQKLFVKLSIKNPLSIEIQISSIKLYCSFLPLSSKGSKTKKSSKNVNEIKEQEKKEKQNDNIINESKDEEKEENPINTIKDKDKEENIINNIKEKDNQNEIKEENINKEDIITKDIENEEGKDDNIKKDITEKINNEEKNINENEDNIDNKKEIKNEEEKNNDKIEEQEIKKEENEISKKESTEQEIQEKIENNIEIPVKEEEKNKEIEENKEQIQKENEIQENNEKNIVNMNEEQKDIEIENKNINESNNEKEEKIKEISNDEQELIKNEEKVNLEQEISKNEKEENIKEITNNEQEPIKNEEKIYQEQDIPKNEKEEINSLEKEDKSDINKNIEEINVNKDSNVINIIDIKEKIEEEKENIIKEDNKLEINNKDSENIEDTKTQEDKEPNDIKNENEILIQDKNEGINNDKENEQQIEDFEIINVEDKKENKTEIINNEDNNVKKNEENIGTDFEVITKDEIPEDNEEKINMEKFGGEREVKENMNEGEKEGGKNGVNVEDNEKEKEIKGNEAEKEEGGREMNEEIKGKDIKDIENDKEVNEKIIEQTNIPEAIESKNEIQTETQDISNITPQNININNINDINNIINNKDTSRPSIEKNFQIDSQIESNQNDYNNITEPTKINPEPQSPEQTPNSPPKTMLSSKSISSEKDSKNIQKVLTYSVCDKILSPGQLATVELNVSSSQEGKIIVKGLEFSLFSQCNIIHLFSKKTSPSLYYYTKKKKIYTMGGASHISSSSSSDYESRNSSELAAKNMILNNIIIPRKNKIEYIVRDFKNDLYVSFPLGTKVNAYLYEMLFFPILIKNNSPEHRVRRYTVFVEEGNKSKLKSFINFLTRDNKIKPRGSQDMIFIPLIPLTTGKLFLKILIKFISDLKQTPIQVKRFLIKLKVKESISFEIKEYCSNLKEDKDGKTLNKIAFNIKTNLRIRNEKEIKKLKIQEPLYSNDLVLINQKNYLINNNEIHKKYVFDKETIQQKNSANNNIDNKFNFDFIQKIITKTFFKNPDDTIPDTSYIVNKFKKILNNSNSNSILFPWEATCTKTDNVDIKEKDKEPSEEKEETLYGLYLYNLKMKNSETTKTFLTFLFNKFTNLNITTKKIDKEKTLIKMILKLDKIGLASMGDKFEKYEIMASPTHNSIVWLGPKNFVVKNNLDENFFTCRFNFITTLKGNIEVNRISVLVYKKPEKYGEQTSIINIKHITKPTTILIE